MLFYSRKNKRTLLFVLSVCYQERKRLFRTEFEGGKMQSNWTGNCPQDVLTEILLRLPVKSLLQFKCVCKYWYAVIGSPGFVRKHFNHENNRTRLLYYTSDNDREGVSFLPDETLLGISSPNDVIDYIQCPQIEAHLIGPIDGLFFVHKCGMTVPSLWLCGTLLRESSGPSLCLLLHHLISIPSTLLDLGWTH